VERGGEVYMTFNGRNFPGGWGDEGSIGARGGREGRSWDFTNFQRAKKKGADIFAGKLWGRRGV